MNPIESMCVKKLREDAIEHHTEHESYEEICN